MRLHAQSFAPSCTVSRSFFESRGHRLLPQRFLVLLEAMATITHPDLRQGSHTFQNDPAIPARVTLSHDVPKAPDVFWIKRLFDRRKFPRYKMHPVSSSSQSAAKLQATPQVLSEGTRPRQKATAGKERSNTVEPPALNTTDTDTSHGSAITQRDLQLTSSSTVVQETAFATEERQSTPRAGDMKRVTPASQELLPASIRARLTQPNSLDTAKQQKGSTAVNSGSPVLDALSAEQKVDNNQVLNSLENNQKEQRALMHAFMIIEHCMKDSEWTLDALLIDMEDHKGSRRISVTCQNGAIHKAREIETILSRAGRGLQGFQFVVRRNKGQRIFGFKGPGDVGTSRDTTDYGSERAYPEGIYTDVYATEYSRGSNNSLNKQLVARGTQAYVDTPYWTLQSTMVECLCASKPSGNLAATPIRMQLRLADGTSTTCIWTCGGVVNVAGENYGLTTAHPYVLVDATRPNPPVDMRNPAERGFVEEDDWPAGNIDFLAMGEYLEGDWQPVGKVSHYALAKIGSFPRNNDWLLFDLPKDRYMWNQFEMSKGPVTDVLAIHTARGVLAATLHEGTAFLILGDSPFEVLKIGLSEPLREYAYARYCNIHPYVD